MLPLATFGPLDWAVLVAYFAITFGIGFWHYRREGAEAYFLAGRSLPAWALAISIVGSSLSAATFVGAPDFAYSNNVTYLITSIGGFMGVFIVGFVFVPKLYRAGTVTIYGFVRQRFGVAACVAVALMFLLGAFLASGSRLFFAAIPLVLLMFNVDDPTNHPEKLILAVALIGLVGTTYTALGGIKAVIWTDLVQFVLVLGAVLLSIGLLLYKIPLSVPEIWALLGTPGTGPIEGTSKLFLVDTSVDFTRSFTLMAAVFGAVFLSVASLGVDHDLAQRFLIAHSPMRGAASVIASQFISVATISLFLVVGLLLWVYYQRPDVMGAAAPGYAPGPNQAAYPQFLLKELPPILSGLAIVGFFAIAQGSMDSAINAMASSLVADVYYPIRQAMGLPVNPSADVHAPKVGVAIIGAVMSLFAIGCVFLYDPTNKTFLDFALGVMTFAFSGMLAVFLCGLLTKTRGNGWSVLAALITGAAIIALLQDGVMAWWSHAWFGQTWKLAWPWWMPIATPIAFCVCLLGRSPPVAAGDALDHRKDAEAQSAAGVSA